MTRRIVLVDIGSGMVLSGVLPSVALFNAYSAKLSARGGVVPYVYSITAGALPDGLFIDSGTGIISGVTTTPGLFSFTVRVTDLSGAFLDRQFSITVIAEPLMLSGHADNGIVDTAYSYTYTVSGGIPPYAWSIVAGALPSGVTLDAGTGELSGTPTAGGARSWTVRVTDSESATADLPDSATFNYATLTLTGTYVAGAVGTSYSSDLTIAGGDGSYSNPHVTSGSLPAGLALSIVGSSLRLSGTPTTAATSSFTAAVDSGDGQTATSAQSVTVTAASTAYRDAVLADSPLHYYRFGESSGTVLANIGTSGTAGTYGSDASNWTGAGLVTGDPTRGLSIPTGTVSTAIVNGGSTTNTDFSVEVIVKPLGVNSGSTGGVIWSYGPAATSCPGLDYVDAGSGRFRLRYMRVGTAVIFTSASTYAYGTKLHVVIRHTRSTHLCEMWINGVKEASTGTFTATTTSFGMVIANQNFPPWITFYGQLDELAYYNNLLSPTRIAAHAALA